MYNHRMGRAVALCLSLSCGMFAQIAAAQQARSDSGQLEEIIVTAEKRESTVQRTPISLTAVSGQDIQDRGLTDLGNLVQSVPGVSIRSSGPGMTEFEMRGVASTGGNSPTVGFYYDDTSLTSPSAANEGKIVISPSLYDLNRVEVLRGPQGTLYGSGSMGGTIKVVPNAPNPAAFDTSAELVFGDTDHGGFDHAENAMVNLPFGGGLAALRIVGSYSRDAGWIDRVVIAPGAFPLSNGTTRGDVLAAPVAADYRDVNDVEKTSVRVSAVVNPVEGLSITPSFFYQKLSSGGLPYIDSDPGTDAHYQPYDISEAYSDTFKLSSINITYKTPILALTSITSYWSRNEPLTQDATESWTTGLGPYVNGYYPPTGLGAASAIEYNPTHQTTEEFRISSVGDSSLKWLVGYYYEDFHSAWDIVFPSQNGAALFGSNNLFSYFSPMPIYQQSVFGEITYNVTEPWAITLGARRYRYDAPVSLDQFGSLTATVVTATSERDQGVTPKISTSYQFTKDLMVYLTAAKGFRPGGGTGPVPTSGPSSVNCEPQLQVEYGSNGAFVQGPISFKSDNVWSYEAGEKWTLADNRVTVNGALYFEKWSGVQQTNALSTCGYVYTANAGNAHVRGGELEIQAIVVPEVTMSGNVGYVHAALVSSELIDAGFNPGTAIQDVPQWTSTVSAAWRHSLTDRLALTARLDSTYTGSRTDETYSINQLPSYDLTNIRAGVDAGHWNAVLFVNNVADKRALISNITQAAENIPTFNRVAVSQPRTAGIDLNYRFGGH
jgi:iron complex outermembrane receptor protein